MSHKFNFALKSIAFDENYVPAENTRFTTNFANLARGEHRQENLRNALRMIDARFNALAHWDNPQGDRYGLEIDILSAELSIDGSQAAPFPLIEILKTTIVDRHLNTRINGIVGNSFSSYVRDYDFSVVLPEHNKDGNGFSLPPQFGELHGNLFKAFVASDVFKAQFRTAPVICLSVSTTKTYERTANTHPVLGVEYSQPEPSLTDAYFAKMGLRVRYFMPDGALAPLAFYFQGDLLNDYTNLELISAIATMESFQKIYRPEIYNANARAGAVYQPSLGHEDYSPTRILYDREERSQLAVEQGKYAEEQFIKPHQDLLTRWSASLAA